MNQDLSLTLAELKDKIEAVRYQRGKQEAGENLGTSAYIVLLMKRIMKK